MWKKRRDGSLTKDYTEILNMQFDFYQELYSSDHNVSFNLINQSGVVLEEEKRLILEEEISMDEIFDALMTLHNNKPQG